MSGTQVYKSHKFPSDGDTMPDKSCVAGRRERSKYNEEKILPYANPQRERAYHRSYQKSHPEIHARAEKKYAQKLKRIVILFYCGNKPHCQCPGCTTAEFCFLSVDHKNGRGHRHKFNKRLKWRISGKALWLWIIKRKFPKQFQVLCWNCNCAKRNEKQCPMAGKVH